jgi:hypothetical protein
MSLPPLEGASDAELIDDEYPTDRTDRIARSIGWSKRREQGSGNGKRAVASLNGVA